MPKLASAMPSLVPLMSPGRAVSVVRRSFPGSAGGSPLQDLQHGRETLDQRGEYGLSLLGGSQGWSAYHSVSRVFAHPRDEEMAPVVRYPVRGLVAVADQLGVRVQQDGGL